MNGHIYTRGNIYSHENRRELATSTSANTDIGTSTTTSMCMTERGIIASGMNTETGNNAGINRTHPSEDRRKDKFGRARLIDIVYGSTSS